MEMATDEMFCEKFEYLHGILILCFRASQYKVK
jgi:hypothetical protein